ncbi:MAG: hypothetical protein LBC75_05795 [Fibromonadaceae bacterium]|jgi:hypothetical protein|nr:hypothetical protein [Fibromonadaceae bacterium]
MKKVLVTILVCIVSTFAAWDYFPVIGEGKGEAKIAFYESRRGYTPGGERHDFKIRYSPIANFELLSRLGYILGTRYQIMPTISAGIDIGLPIPNPVWHFTPNVQFSTHLTSALELGSNAEFTISTEDPRNEYTDAMYLKIGAELNLTTGQSILWTRLDLSTDLGEDIKISPTLGLGYKADIDNLSLGTSVGMDFGEKSSNEPYNTIIGLDAAIKF